IIDLAGPGDHVSCRGAAKNGPSLRQPVIVRTCDCVVVRCVLCRIRVELVDETQLRAIEVVHGQQLTVPTRIGCRQQRVVRVANRQVVGPDYLLVAATEVADGDCKPGLQLVLYSEVPQQLIRALEARGSVSVTANARGAVS